MRNAVLQDQVRSYNLGIVEVEIIAFDCHSDDSSCLRKELQAVCERRQVTDEVGDDVSVHETWSCGVCTRNIGASEGGVGRY